jgi:hypothetical protein
MGAGLALESKNRYPSMYADYFQRYNRKEVEVAKPYLYKSANLRWF